MSNTDLTKKTGVHSGVREEQAVPAIYSYRQSSPVKSLVVIEGKNIYVKSNRTFVFYEINIS
jgi:hypothetical protein